MLKRIAVVDHGKAIEPFAEAAQAQGVELVSVPDAEALPPATAAVLASPDAASRALPLALRVGERQEQLLMLLAQAIDCREEFAPEASLRVWQHAQAFAEALGLSNADRLTLERGALIRDIGKLQIPNEILLKDAILSYDEWELIRQHPARGAAMVREMGGLEDTADIVLYHHECFDGSGYPEGLSGERIPLLGRVMKILDVYCAMTSRRHYRPGVSTAEEALAHLQAESGTRFDPELVRVFAEANLAAIA
jgi:putative nucleotidyltransferase with HDIG domain